MRELVAQIEIDAPVDVVWRVLTDFPAYPRWNRFLPRVEGSLTVGERLRLTAKPAPVGRLSFSAVVVAVEPEREVRWLGTLLTPALFAGEHSFLLEALSDTRTRLTQREQFTGFLVPVVPMEGNRRGYAEMNLALKAEAERQAS